MFHSLMSPLPSVITNTITDDVTGVDSDKEKGPDTKVNRLGETAPEKFAGIGLATVKVALRSLPAKRLGEDKNESNEFPI